MQGATISDFGAVASRSREPCALIWHFAELVDHRDSPRDYDAHLRRRVELACADLAVADVDRRRAGPLPRRPLPGMGHRAGARSVGQ
jgi:hypothetical protein